MHFFTEFVKYEACLLFSVVLTCHILKKGIKFISGYIMLYNMIVLDQSLKNSSSQCSQTSLPSSFALQHDQYNVFECT